jgi:hypothetical protein
VRGVWRLAIATVVVVVGAGALGGAVMPSAARADVAAGGVVDAPSAADAASARVIAETFGHAVVVDSETSPVSSVSVLPSGLFQLQSSNVPVRARVAGSWVGVDTRLVRVGGWLQPAVSAAPVRFSPGGSAVLDQVQTSSGSWVSESWPYGVLPAPTVDGSTATYADVLAGVDVKLTVTSMGMTSVWVVKSAAAAASLADLRLDVSGAQVSQASSGELVADAGDGSPIRGAEPVWWDSSSGGTFAQPGGDVPARPVTSSVTSSGVSMDVSASVDAADGSGLLAPLQSGVPDAVVYPVFVDPDWSSGMTASWYTDKTYANTSYLSTGPSYILRLGIYSTWQSEIFFQFPIGALAGKGIVSAQLATTQTSLNACPTNPIAIEVFGPQGAGFTWNQEHSWSGQWHGVLQTQTPGSCANPNATVPVGWNVSSGVASQVGQSVIQFGILSASSAASRRNFAPGATLTVTYDSPPNTPTGLSVASPLRGCGTAAAPVRLNNAAQPLVLQATVTDPDPGAVVNASFQIMLASQAGLPSPTLVTSADPGGYPPGVQQESFAAGTLTDGTAYAWRVIAGDNIMLSPYSGYCYFTVDNTAPSAPTVSFASPPTGLIVGQGVPVTITPGTATDVAGFEYWVSRSGATSPAASVPVPISLSGVVPTCGSQQGPVTFVCPSGGSFTANVAPIDDDSVLWVASYDAAGNVSTASPLPLLGAGGSAAVLAGTASFHSWPMDGLASPLASTIGDSNTTVASDTTGEKDLTVGSGILLSTTDTIDTVAGVPVLPFTGTASTANVVATAGPGVDTTASFTASAWVKPSTNSGTLTILAQSGASTSGFVLEDVNEKMMFCVQPQVGSSPPDCAKASSVSPAGTWVMVTGVWDAVDHQVRLVVGDSTVNEAVAPHVPPPGDVTAAGPVTVGSAQGGGVPTNAWNGYIANPLLTQELIDTTTLNALWSTFS